MIVNGLHKNHTFFLNRSRNSLGNSKELSKLTNHKYRGSSFRPSKQIISPKLIKASKLKKSIDLDEDEPKPLRIFSKENIESSSSALLRTTVNLLPMIMRISKKFSETRTRLNQEKENKFFEDVPELKIERENDRFWSKSKPIKDCIMKINFQKENQFLRNTFSNFELFASKRLSDVIDKDRKKIHNLYSTMKNMYRAELFKTAVVNEKVSGIVPKRKNPFSPKNKKFIN